MPERVPHRRHPRRPHRRSSALLICLAWLVVLAMAVTKLRQADGIRVASSGFVAVVDYINAFVLRSEFTNKYAGSLDGPGFVDAVLATIANDIGVDLTAQRQALIDAFNQAGGGNAGRGIVMFRLANDDLAGGNGGINNRSFIDAEYNRAFVFTQYAGYLRRNPDMPGFLFWLNQVNRGPLRDGNTQHAMVCSFITSAEYQQRDSSVVTYTNADCPQ